MSETYLIVSIVGLALTVNALRPFPGTLPLVPGFFAGWLTVELAPQLLVLHVAANLYFLAAGVRGVPGFAGAGLSALTAAGLGVLVAESLRVARTVEEALRDGLGSSYTAAEYSRVRWSKIANPFWFHDPRVERIRNVAYADGGRRNLLDVYRPRTPSPTPMPVLLQIHGGGWVISNKNQQGKPIMLHFASRGWVCFAPNYRLSPRAAFPDHLVDVKRAIAWIREHAHEYGADPSFILITGGSAGAHLAALAALTPNDPLYQPGFEEADTTVQAAAPMYGVYDFTNEDRKHAATKHRMRTLEWFVMKKKFAASRAEYENASPHYRASASAPPFFVAHGRNDSLASVAETGRFVEKLRETSTEPVVYAELPHTQHAFDVFYSIRSMAVIEGIERFGLWARTGRTSGKSLSS